MKLGSKKKSIILIAAVCIVLCAALLIPVTLAKYIHSLNGYAQMGIQPFNAAIIPVEYTEGEGESTVKKTVRLSSKDFHPGMQYSTEIGSEALPDTSAITEFYVANGTEEANAVTMPLQYTVRIRTGCSLPLRYTLMIINDEGEAEYYSTEGDPIKIIDENSEIRYEYYFSPISTTEIPPLDEASIFTVPLGTPAETEPNGDLPDDSSGAEETEAQLMTEAPPSDEPTPEVDEAKFMLERDEAAEKNYVQNQHALIAEWPGGTEYSKSEYMKEVELIEIVVTVTSLNNLENSSGGATTTTPPDYYGEGIVVITPAGGTSYSYEIDLRSFQSSETTGVFYFKVDNGVGYGYKYDGGEKEIRYSMEFKVPIELIDGTYGGKKYTFDIFRNDLKEGATDLTSPTPSSYRIYNDKTGEPLDDIYTTEAAAKAALSALRADPDNEKQAAHYAVYAMYSLSLGTNDTLYNETYIGGVATPNNWDNHGYTVRISPIDGILTNEIEEMTFLCKLELLINASFVN